MSGQHGNGAGQSQQNKKPETWFEMKITGNVRNLSAGLFNFSHLTALHLKGNSLTTIPPDIRKLVCLKKLDASFNNLTILPGEIGDLVNLRELYLDHNYLCFLPYEIGKLFNLNILTLDDNPLDDHIINLYKKSDGVRMVLSYLLNSISVKTPKPPKRQWITLATPSVNKQSCIFSVMSYNILSDTRASRQMYTHCPGWALTWNRRKNGILKEIRGNKPDIICMQEIEMETFHKHFYLELKSNGYEGIFSLRHKSKKPDENDVGGCAIFFKTAKFTLLKKEVIEYSELAEMNADGLRPMLNRVASKDNIGFVAILKTTGTAWKDVLLDASMPPQVLLVCTTHIHWDPQFCDAKLIQTMLLCSKLKTILDETVHSEAWAGEIHYEDIEMILCGTFNSLPNSGVIDFLNSGKISHEHQDFKKFNYQQCLEKILDCDDSNNFTHSFGLASAYSKDVMPYTNYTFEFKGVIDYIFYSKRKLTPLEIVGPISADWLNEYKVVGCPHPWVYSDHFYIMTKLEWTL